MKLRSRDLARALQEIESRLKPLIESLDHLCYMANENMDSGVSGISYDSKGRQSGPSDPVSSRATRGGGDQIARDARRLVDGIKRAQEGLREADRAAWGLRALTLDEAKLLAEKDEIANKAEAQTIAPQCANPHCDRLGGVSAETRLRGGRCPACYMYRYRSGGVVERPKELCALDTQVGVLSSDGLGLDADRLIVAEEVA